MVGRPAALQGVPGESRRRRHARGGLRRRLASTYVQVTLVAALVIEGFALLAIAQGVLYSQRLMHVFAAEDLAPVAADLLTAGAAPEALQAYLDRPVSGRDDEGVTAHSLPQAPRGYAVVTGSDGTTWFDTRSAVDPYALAPELPETSDAKARTPGDGAVPSPRDHALIRSALSRGETALERGMFRTATATPLEANGRTVGVLLQVSTLVPMAPGLVAIVASALITGGLGVVAIGTAFGLVASRPLTRRLAALSDAADAWSRGELDRSVNDPGDDELGRVAQHLDRMAEDLDELVRARQSLASADERARLARDLHDSVKQQLFGASLLLGAARRSDGDDARDAISAAGDLVDQAKRELTDLIHEMRPVEDEERSILAALRQWSDARPLGTLPTVDVDVRDHLGIPPRWNAVLLRVAREALSNALRHADAQHVRIVLTHEAGSLVLSVEDDGVGFDPAAVVGTGLGLASMRERAERAGGELSVASAPGVGTRVTLALPNAYGRASTHVAATQLGGEAAA